MVILACGTIVKLSLSVGADSTCGSILGMRRSILTQLVVKIKFCDWVIENLRDNCNTTWKRTVQTKLVNTLSITTDYIIYIHYVNHPELSRGIRLIEMLWIQKILWFFSIRSKLFATAVTFNKIFLVQNQISADQINSVIIKIISQNPSNNHKYLFRKACGCISKKWTWLSKTKMWNSDLV